MPRYLIVVDSDESYPGFADGDTPQEAMEGYVGRSYNHHDIYVVDADHVVRFEPVGEQTIWKQARKVEAEVKS